MWTSIITFFSNTKNLVLAVIALFVSGYVVKQKYNAYKAEDKLKTIETKIAKANVEIVKEKAKAKAQAREVETATEVAVLRVLKKEKAKVVKELTKLEKELEKSNINKKVKVTI